MANSIAQPGGLKLGGDGVGRAVGNIVSLPFPTTSAISNDVVDTTIQEQVYIPVSHRVRGVTVSASALTAVVAATDPTVDVYRHFPVPDPPSVALISPAAAGNVDNGAHHYVVTNVNAAGETTPSSTVSVTVSDKSVNGKVTVTLPIGPSGTTSRKIYRTIAAGTPLLYLATVSDNTTTSYTDNIADASIGVVPGAVTAALAGAGAGNVEDGAHDYAVTFVTSFGETLPSSVVIVTVADKTTDGKVSISAVPLGPSGTTARKLYRSAAGLHQLKLLTTLSDNTTTTYTDNTADGSLGANVPTASNAFQPPITNTAAATVLSTPLVLSTTRRNLVCQPVSAAMSSAEASDPKESPACIYSTRAVTGATSGAVTNLSVTLDIELLA